MRIQIVAAAVLSILLSVSTAMAVPSGGESEVQLGADFVTQQGSDSGSVVVDIEWGRYTGDAQWEIGIRQSGHYNFEDGGPDNWLAVTSPFAHFNFVNDSNWLPYLGGFVGAVWNDDDLTGTVGPEAGVRAFVSDDTFVNFGYRYEWFFEDFDTADDTASDGNHVGLIGIGFIY